MSHLLVAEEIGTTPAHCLAGTAYMLEAVAKGRTGGKPWLKLSRPSGAAVVLGRYQRVTSAVHPEVVAERELSLLRRLTGGSTALLGSGVLHVALALPDRCDPLDCEPRQFLQRYGAGVIRGLVQAGLKARYFGKDLLSVEDRPVGIISFELAEGGAALLEAIIGLQQPFSPEGDLVAYPTRTKAADNGGRTQLSAELDELDEAALLGSLSEAVAELLELEVQAQDFSPLEGERIKSLLHRVEVPSTAGESLPPYLRTSSSRPVEEAIGFVEASVRLAQGRFLRDVTITGDFMADAAGVADLEEKLKMVPVKRRPVALVIDDVLGAPDHVIMGIRRLGSLLEAILDAAKQAGEENDKASD